MLIDDARIINQIQFKEHLKCPKCDREDTMRYIKGRYGWFWGCKRYPSCTGTLSVERVEDDIKEYLGVHEYDDLDMLERPYFY